MEDARRLAGHTEAWSKLPEAECADSCKAAVRLHQGLDIAVEAAGLRREDVRSFVDIGAELGNSTRLLLSLFPNAIGAAVDPWPEAYNIPREWPGVRTFSAPFNHSLLPMFLACNAAYRNRLMPIRADSAAGLLKVRDLGLEPEVIYVDGDHTYHGVTTDLVMADALFPQAVIIGNAWSFSAKFPKYQGIEKSVQKAAKGFAFHRSRTLSVHSNVFIILPNPDHRCGNRALPPQEEPAKPEKPAARPVPKAVPAPAVQNDAKKTEPAPAFLHCRNGKKKCVTVFSSFAFGTYADDAFSFKTQFMPHLEHTDLLFVKDVKNQWYNRNLPGLGQNVDEAVEGLNRIFKDYDDVTLFGSSMGAYASLLYGQRLDNVSRIIAIAPQTMLKSPFPRYNPRIHSGHYREIADGRFPENIDVDIFVGNNELYDIYQAFSLPPQDNVTITSVSGAFHNVLAYWHDVKLMDDFIKTFTTDNDYAALRSGRFIDGENQPPFNNDLSDPKLREQIAQAVLKFYHGDHREASVILHELVEWFPDWAGALSLLGQCYFEFGEWERAITYFEKVSQISRTVDGHFKSWVTALMTLGEREKAREVAKLAYSINKTMAYLKNDICK